MKEQVIALAKQAGDDWDSTRREDKEFLARFYALVRDAALEEAAEVCRDVQDRDWIINLKEPTP